MQNCQVSSVCFTATLRFLTSLIQYICTSRCQQRLRYCKDRKQPGVVPRIVQLWLFTSLCLVALVCLLTCLRAVGSTVVRYYQVQVCAKNCAVAASRRRNDEQRHSQRSRRCREGAGVQ